MTSKLTGQFKNNLDSRESLRSQLFDLKKIYQLWGSQKWSSKWASKERFKAYLQLTNCWAADVNKFFLKVTSMASRTAEISKLIKVLYCCSLTFKDIQKPSSFSSKLTSLWVQAEALRAWYKAIFWFIFITIVNIIAEAFRLCIKVLKLHIEWKLAI